MTLAHRHPIKMNKGFKSLVTADYITNNSYTIIIVIGNYLVFVKGTYLITFNSCNEPQLKATYRNDIQNI